MVIHIACINVYGPRQNLPYTKFPESTDINCRRLMLVVPPVFIKNVKIPDKLYTMPIYFKVFLRFTSPVPLKNYK